MKNKKEKIDTKEIFSDSNIITIIHQGQEYQLRITKSDKLILTK